MATFLTPHRNGLRVIVLYSSLELVITPVVIALEEIRLFIGSPNKSCIRVAECRWQAELADVSGSFLKDVPMVLPIPVKYNMKVLVKFVNVDMQ